MISDPKVKAYIAKKRQAKEELKRFRQTGGERGLAARKAQGIHGKLDLDEESDELNDEQMVDVASSSEEEEEVAVKAVAKVVRRSAAAKKITKKVIMK